MANEFNERQEIEDRTVMATSITLILAGINELNYKMIELKKEVREIKKK